MPARLLVCNNYRGVPLIAFLSQLRAVQPFNPDSIHMHPQFCHTINHDSARMPSIEWVSLPHSQKRSACDTRFAHVQFVCYAVITACTNKSWRHAINTLFFCLCSSFQQSGLSIPSQCRKEFPTESQTEMYYETVSDNIITSMTDHLLVSRLLLEREMRDDLVHTICACSCSSS